MRTRTSGIKPGLVYLHLIFLSLFSSLPLSADSLSLEDCIARALAHNYQYRQDRNDIEIARSMLRRAEAPFGLDAAVGVALPSYEENRITLDDPALSTRVRNEESDLSYAGTLDLQKQVKHVGRFSLATRATRQDFDSNRREGFLDYRGDMLLGYSRSIISKPSEEIELSRAQFVYANAVAQFERRRLQTEKDTADDYFDLVRSIRKHAIEERRLEQSEKSHQLARRKFEIGMLAEVELMSLKVALLSSRASYAAAQTEIESRRDALRHRIGLEMFDSLDVVTDVEHRKLNINEERALELALGRNTRLLVLKKNEKIEALDLIAVRQSHGLSARLQAEVGLRGQGPRMGDVSRNLERNMWSFRVDVRIPLVDAGWRRSQVGVAGLKLENTRLQQSSTKQAVVASVRSTVRGLAQADHQIDLAESRIDVAERAYTLRRKRFGIGEAGSQELLSAEEELTKARTDALNAMINYQRQLMDLRQITMSTLSDIVLNGSALREVEGAPLRIPSDIDTLAQAGVRYPR